MILLNAPLVGQRLGYPDLSGLDLLELFAFVHPARFAVPTPKGLAHALGLDAPATDAEAAPFLLRGRGRPARHSGAATGPSAKAPGPRRSRCPAALAVGAGGRRSGCAGRSATSAGCSRACPNGRRTAPRPQPRPVRVDEDEAVERLTGLAGSERRDPRGPARLCRGRRRAPSLRATARGPAQHAARRGRHRDRQDARLSRPGLALGRESATARSGSRPSPRRCSASSTARARACSPTPRSGKRKVVVRKGRENYLCLLNLEDALQGGFAGRAAILAQLVARWAAYSQGRRHGRRRPARLAADPVPPRRVDRADRPARRMRLCRLPALPQMLHRTLGARERRTPTSSSPTTRW